MDDSTREKWLQRDETGRTLFDRSRCPHCNGVHDVAPCPRVKRMEFMPVDGKSMLTAIEFWQWDQWPHHLVLFETELYTD